MLTFRQFINESATKNVAAVALAARIASLDRQIQQDRTATKAEKILSSEFFWLAALLGLNVAGGKSG
jgi:hypothetical protein